MAAGENQEGSQMEATQELPGSEGKIAVLQARLEAYEAQERDLHHPDDDRTPTEPPVYEFDSQYQDRSVVPMTPHQRLGAGVIREAIEAILQFRRAKDDESGELTVSRTHELKTMRMDAIQSANWLFSDEASRRNKLSFPDVCELFGADPDAMRQSLVVRLGGNLEDGELL
jgi:hypothetical protein